MFIHLILRKAEKLKIESDTILRIIAGSFKGRKVAVLPGVKTRPTSARVRESLFSILGSPRIIGANVLDLFAGTGALGIEALSRGALRVTFVDNASSAVKIITQNCDLFGIKECRIIRDDAGRFLRRHHSFASYDLIFIDPPYNKGYVELILPVIGSVGTLGNDGILVLEESRTAKVDNSYGKIELVDARYYGETVLYFFQNKGA